MFTESTLQRLRALPIEELASSLGLAVKRHAALCPFHQDHHPSLVLNPRHNSYRCYACGAHGDTISLVMNLRSLSFPDACRELASLFGIILEDEGRKPPLSSHHSSAFSHHSTRAPQGAPSPWEKLKAKLQSPPLGGTEGGPGLFISPRPAIPRSAKDRPARGSMVPP